jgi:Mrp family chromosome partitioning ATPase
MLVTDAAILARKGKVDGVLIVARSRSTTRSTLTRTVQVFRRGKANILGIVHNAIDTSSSEYYYEQGYYYHRGEGYYGETRE